MKLNFDYCKKCKNTFGGFESFASCFIFICDKCGDFRLGKTSYKPEKFNVDGFVETRYVTNEEWIDIKKKKITYYDTEDFNKCPYKLEHILDDQP